MSNKTFEKENCDNHAKCMELIQSVLDGSANEVEIAHLKDNIDKCRPCYEGYALEKAIKENHATKVKKECCPQKTIELLKQKLGLALSILVGIIIECELINLLILS